MAPDLDEEGREEAVAIYEAMLPAIVPPAAGAESDKAESMVIGQFLEIFFLNL